MCKFLKVQIVTLGENFKDNIAFELEYFKRRRFAKGEVIQISHISLPVSNEGGFITTAKCSLSV